MTQATALATPPGEPSSLTRAALEALYSRLERRVFNVVYRWLWNKDDASDVVQEAFVKLWTMRERVRMESVEALLYRIAVNLAANRRRQRQVWSFVTLEGLRADPIALDDVQREVRAAVDALPERLRRVVVLGEFVLARASTNCADVRCAPRILGAERARDRRRARHPRGDRALASSPRARRAEATPRRAAGARP